MATSSPLNNRPYGANSIADRPTREIGRSASNPRRLLEQALRRLRSQGDVVGAAQMSQSNQWLNVQQGRRMPQGSPMPMAPMEPLTPPSSSVPASSRAPAPEMNAPDAPMPDAPAPAPEVPMSFEDAFNASPLAGAGPPPLSRPVPPMMLPADTPPEMLNALNQGAFAGVYTKAPAPFEAVPIPGTRNAGVLKNGQATGSIVGLDLPAEPPSYVPVPGMQGMMVPTGPGADRLPLAQEVPNPGWSVTGQPKTKLQPIQEQQQDAEMPKFQRDTVSGRMFWIEPKQGGGYIRRFVEDANNDGIPDNQQGAPAGGAAPASTAAKKPSDFLSFLK